MDTDIFSKYILIFLLIHISHSTQQLFSINIGIPLVLVVFVDLNIYKGEFQLKLSTIVGQKQHEHIWGSRMFDLFHFIMSVHVTLVCVYQGIVWIHNTIPYFILY